MRAKAENTHNVLFGSFIQGEYFLVSLHTSPGVTTNTCFESFETKKNEEELSVRS